jgi:hypothetical protein
MHLAAATTLFCHLLLVYLEQLTKYVSSKAKINLEEGIDLTQTKLQQLGQPLQLSTMFALSKWNLCGITYHTGN